LTVAATVVPVLSYSAIIYLRCTSISLQQGTCRQQTVYPCSLHACLAELLYCCLGSKTWEQRKPVGSSEGIRPAHARVRATLTSKRRRPKESTQNLPHHSVNLQLRRRLASSSQRRCVSLNAPEPQAGLQETTHVSAPPRIDSNSNVSVRKQQWLVKAKKVGLDD